MTGGATWTTKKSYRLGDKPHFYGVPQRSHRTPLGSIAVWRPDSDRDFNEVLFSIWANLLVTHPWVFFNGLLELGGIPPRRKGFIFLRMTARS